MVSYNPDKDIPDLSGKVILVTGGNAGLGYEMILQLAKHKPAHIYLGARDAGKASAAIAQIEKEVGAVVGNENVPRITFLQLDLASFDSIRSAAQTFTAAESKLDLLVNNAGALGAAPAQTKDGYEFAFGTNHMGHALLVHLLLPTLERTANASPDADVRIVILGSEALMMAPNNTIQFTEAHSDMASHGLMQRYGHSKLANVVYAKALAEKYPKILSVTVHPGMVKTQAVDQFGKVSLMWKAVAFLMSIASTSVSKGVWNQLWAATAPRKLVKSGAYYVPVMKEVPGSKGVQDVTLRDQLWEWTQNEFSSKGL